MKRRRDFRIKSTVSHFGSIKLRSIVEINSSPRKKVLKMKSFVALVALCAIIAGANAAALYRKFGSKKFVFFRNNKPIVCSE